MLEKLVESTDNTRHNRRLRTLFATIGSGVTGLVIVGLVFSIFNTNLAMGSDAIDLSRLVAPALLPENAPPKPEPKLPSKTQESAVTRMTQRVNIIQRLEEVPFKSPTTVSTTPNKFRARPDSPFLFNAASDIDGTSGPNTNGSERRGSGDLNGPGFDLGDPGAGKTARKPIDAKKPDGPPPILAKKLPPQTGGVVNGKAIDLVIPVRSSSAISVGAKGPVHVDVLIGETGKVESAKASSGHPLLRSAAVSAALRSTFLPTKLSDQPVKVKGVIIYNFN